MWFVYIVQCKDNSFYTGLTNDIQKRIRLHNDGQGARHTKLYGPVKLRYYEEFEERFVAMKREKEVKQWPRERRERLLKFGLGKKFK